MYKQTSYYLIAEYIFIYDLKILFQRLKETFTMRSWEGQYNLSEVQNLSSWMTTRSPQGSTVGYWTGQQISPKTCY